MNRRLLVAPAAGLVAAAWLLVDVPLCAAGVEVAAMTGLVVAGSVEVGRRWVRRSS